MNIPKHTNCTNCGKCCGIIPATVREIEAIRNYMDAEGVTAIKRADKTICPFRDEVNKTCLIYPVRPVICRLYGVAKSDTMRCPNGNSAEIDGSVFLPKDDKDVGILNFEF